MPRAAARRATAVAACLVLAASCTVEAGEDEGAAGEEQPSRTIEVADWRAEEERAYVDRALSVLEDRYHGTDEVDWDELRQVAHQRLGDAPSRIRSYLAINAVLTRIGHPGNRLVSPGASQQTVADRPGDLPTVERVGDVLTVTLPPVALHHDTSADYVAHALAAIRSAPAVCGWIVDLRGFTHGTMFHPLAVLGPVLAGQPALTLEHADGTVETAVAVDADGSLLQDGRPAADALADDLSDDEGWLPDAADRGRQALSDLGPLPTPVPDLPVAVLTSSQTAGGGEAVVVALAARPETRRFGRATYGVPIGGDRHDLDDGAVLFVAETRMVDRGGDRYGTSIPPDVATSDPEADAAAWLEDHGTCTASR